MTQISTTPVSDFDAAVRQLSGGTNVAIYNDLGLPSIYVRRDKGMISDVIEGGPDTTHYAFKVNGAEVPAFYMGKYLATVYKGRALSLPLQDPAAFTVENSDIGEVANNSVNFNNAKIWCEANGAGFHLPTIAEYAWIALLSRKNGTQPHGNNNYGQEEYARYEAGVTSYIDSNGRILRTLTGSGPATWNDNWRPDGICDLNGNVYEWQGGYRTVDGELQILADNDAAMICDQSAASTLWKAILQDGTLVEPGTNGSLKWDYVTDPGTAATGGDYCLNTMLNYKQTSNNSYGKKKFKELRAAEGVNVPDILKALALMPIFSGAPGYGEAYACMKNNGEMLAVCGGNVHSRGTAGVFDKSGEPRTLRSLNHGFRPAFIPGI